MAEDDKPPFWQRFLEEAGTPFEPPPRVELDSIPALYAAVLSNYGNRCAMTGESAEVLATRNEELLVTAIRPLRAGGALHVGNFLALSPAADDALLRGHLTIGAAHELVLDLARIDRDLLDSLNPTGALLPPVLPETFPDSEALAWHRDAFFARLALSMEPPLL